MYEALLSMNGRCRSHREMKAARYLPEKFTGVRIARDREASVPRLS
jgi:hypothetical protein